jgi:hypothetical protein
VTIVLPADYNIDPTGVGRMLGLTDMGETKQRLAAEAEADRQAEQASVQPDELAALGKRIDGLEAAVLQLVDVTGRLVEVKAAQVPAGPVTGALASPDAAATAAPAGAGADAPAEQASTAPAATAAAAAAQPVVQEEAMQPAARADNASFTLAPGQGIEIKLVMQKDAQANFAWMSEGGPVNFDLHGDGPGGNKISYEKGRGVDAKRGTLVAAFDGNHGWFWRNRGEQPVTVTLQTRGYYSEIKGLP